MGGRTGLKSGDIAVETVKISGIQVRQNELYHKEKKKPKGLGKTKPWGRKEVRLKCSTRHTTNCGSSTRISKKNTKSGGAALRDHGKCLSTKHWTGAEGPIKKKNHNVVWVRTRKAVQDKRSKGAQ